MKKGIATRAWLLLTSLIIIFSACKKDINNSNDPKSQVMAFNLTVDRPSIGYLISHNYLTDGSISFPNSTGNYLPVFSGTQNVKLFDATTDSILATKSYTFVTNKKYSLFAVGSYNNYQNIIVNDNFDSLIDSSGNAYVRYVNAIPNTSGASLLLNIEDSTILNTTVSYATVSDLKKIPSGNITLKIENQAGHFVSKTISLEKNKIYTLLLISTPGSKDPINDMQISYIENNSIASN